jgi:DNA-binding response OmpR family regulator
MPQHRILIVEDDPEMRALLVEGIDTSHEFRLTTAATCSAAQALVGREHFDIVVLDLGLPDVDGCEGVATLRESFSGPILVLSGRSAECDVVSALEAGATDYVNKPFRFPILIARIALRLGLPRLPTALSSRLGHIRTEPQHECWSLPTVRS